LPFIKDSLMFGWFSSAIGRKEGGVGADYLWWWLDQASDECFGMLVQAKRLERSANTWRVDVGRRKGEQLRELLLTAEQFAVPAMFAVYTGGRLFREDLGCPHGEGPACVRCQRMAISMISAFQLGSEQDSPVYAARMVFNDSIPLESLADSTLGPGRIVDLNSNSIVSPGLRAFLLDEQTGPRDIARRIFAAVSKHRAGQFALIEAESMTIATEPIFPVVPRDRGHYPASYFDHFLRGLRVAPPDSVRDIENNRSVPLDVSRRVAGVILIYV
jgi:hypothetical protein